MTTKNKASAEAISEEQSSRGYDAEASSAFDFRGEIGKKLRQAKGICIVLCDTHDLANTPVSASLWAASELIEDVEKALDELRDIEHGRTPKEVQS